MPCAQMSLVITRCVWAIIGDCDYYFVRVGGAAGCNPRSPLKISILKTAGSRSSAQMIHQQLSSICLCHLQRPLLLRTPVLSNAFVIYCISLCISSSSSFQPSLFIHFHLQFDTTSTHNEAMDKLQISEEDPKLWTNVEIENLHCAAKFTIFWQCLNPKIYKTRSLGTDGVYQPTVGNHFLQIWNDNLCGKKETTLG